MEWGSSIYEGWVMHRRLRPRNHRFRYSVFALLLDLDELALLDRRLLLFKYNRRGLFSFHDKDHGCGGDLNLWLDELLAKAGISAKGRRRVLCYPRILGFVFNPLSVWFCEDQEARLKAIVYEVHNTYEERHVYVLAVSQDLATLRHDCPKEFYVSPFLSRDCHYHFRIRPPDGRVAIAIREDEGEIPVLHASFAGGRCVLGDKALAKMLLRYPLMTLKVVAAIHFEAVRLMLKGVRRHPHRPKTVYSAAQ